ncbi:MAG: hypothetical protein HYY55_02970 [Candidatus Niyogibacteria bacterium]|nr:MAG: hypothetical protein HYY55_02970 [Candidatus Niyogibacteria bacterium]
MDRQKQTGKFISRIAENLPEMNKEAMQRWIDDPQGLQEYLRGLSPEFDLLKFVGTVRVDGAERFVCDDEALKKANVGWTGSNFDRLFKGKVEENVSATELNIHKLKKPSVDQPIRKELGDKEEIHLVHFLNFLKNQNGGWCIAYIRDKKGKLWAVRACWFSVDRYWDVAARSVKHPFGWSAGSRVVSRK